MNDRAGARSWYRSRSRSVNLKTSMHCSEGHSVAKICLVLSSNLNRGIPDFLRALRHAFRTERLTETVADSLSHLRACFYATDWRW